MKVWLQRYGVGKEVSMYSAVEWLDAEAYQRDNPNVN
jgi:hypothetical protein